MSVSKLTPHTIDHITHTLLRGFVKAIRTEGISEYVVTDNSAYQSRALPLEIHFCSFAIKPGLPNSEIYFASSHLDKENGPLAGYRPVLADTEMVMTSASVVSAAGYTGYGLAVATYQACKGAANITKAASVPLFARRYARQMGYSEDHFNELFKEKVEVTKTLPGTDIPIEFSYTLTNVKTYERLVCKK